MDSSGRRNKIQLLNICSEVKTWKSGLQQFHWLQREYIFLLFYDSNKCLLKTLKITWSSFYRASRHRFAVQYVECKTSVDQYRCSSEKKYELMETSIHNENPFHSYAIRLTLLNITLSISKTFKLKFLQLSNCFKWEKRLIRFYAYETFLIWLNLSFSYPQTCLGNNFNRVSHMKLTLLFRIWA